MIPVYPPPETRCRSLEQKDDGINKEENARNLTKSKGIAPRLCIGDLRGVRKLSRKNHVSIRTQTAGISYHEQECSFSHQNEIGSILRARVDSIKFTASTHVFTRIKATKSSPNALI